MNIYRKITGALLVALATSASVSAQLLPADKKASQIDLGWGVAQSEFLSTAATATVSGDELRQTSATSLADALHAKLPGLVAIKNGGFEGEEGRTPWLTLRGFKTFYDDSILILVDGYERPIDRITVDEVESVTVLKDAAAVALFGPEAIDGVVYVKTRRGYEGKTEVKVGYAHKFTFDPEFAKMVDAEIYAAAMNKALKNDGGAERYSEAELVLFANGKDPYFYPNVDWREEALKNSGFENRANLSVAGGNDKVKYYTMLDYTGAHGLLKNTKQGLYDSQLKYSKANIRTNVDFAISSTTKMSVNVLGVFMETNAPANLSSYGISSRIYNIPASVFPVKTMSGMWGGNQEFGSSNLAAQIQGTGFAKTHQRQLWADAKLVQDLEFWLPGLSVSMEAGYDNASLTSERHAKNFKYGYERYTGAVGDGNNVEEVSYGDNETKLTISDNVDSQWRVANFAVGAHYKRSFRGDDNFATSLIYNIKNEVRDGRNQTFNRMNIMGVMHYDLKNRYVADLVLSANGSNRSYPAIWSFSPTLSLGYIFADKAEGLLNYGKLRASAGILHTDYVPEPGLWLAAWDAGWRAFYHGTDFRAGGGTFLGAFPTTKFSKERSTAFNVGLDTRFFNALDVTAEVYYQQRSNILLYAGLVNSYVVGIQSAYSDVGGVRSYGFELSARYGKEIAKDLFVNASAMMSWGRNEVTDYIGSFPYPGIDPVKNRDRVQEAYGLEAIGFFADQADIDNSPRQEFGPVRPGDIKYRDINGDGVVNQLDYVALGKSNYLPELNYGFSIGAEFKGLGFNATFQGASNFFQNLKGVNGVWNVLEEGMNLSQDYYNNSWDVVADKSKAKFPRLSSQINANNNVQSTMWMKELSFFKLRYCEVYYKLPVKLVDKIGLGGVKVFVQGANLWGRDNVAAMDAEILSNAFPTLKSYNVGASVTF